jgi:hypothetical protein
MKHDRPAVAVPVTPFDSFDRQFLDGCETA